jgi:hypothetical protein
VGDTQPRDQGRNSIFVYDSTHNANRLDHGTVSRWNIVAGGKKHFSMGRVERKDELEENVRLKVPLSSLIAACEVTCESV